MSEDKVLRGRYKRLIAPTMRDAVEWHYNHGMVPAQRRAFKAVVKSIFEHILGPSQSSDAVDEMKIVAASALMDIHAKDLISPSYRYHVISWLSTATQHQQQSFRDTMCKVHGLKLFNGQSQTKMDYAPHLLQNSAESVRKREVEHMMRAQRAAELFVTATPTDLPQRPPPPIPRPVTHVVQRAHDPSQKGAPWGTLFSHSDMPQPWCPHTLAETRGSTFLTHGRPMQNYNENYANEEIRKHKRAMSAGVRVLPTPSSSVLLRSKFEPGIRPVPAVSEICIRDPSVRKK